MLTIHSVQDGSKRYVAEENIIIAQVDSMADETLYGEFFKRYDTEAKQFVSNMTESYPDG